MQSSALLRPTGRPSAGEARHVDEPRRPWAPADPAGSCPQARPHQAFAAAVRRALGYSSLPEHGIEDDSLSPASAAAIGRLIGEFADGSRDLKLLQDYADALAGATGELELELLSQLQAALARDPRDADPQQEQSPSLLDLVPGPRLDNGMGDSLPPGPDARSRPADPTPTDVGTPRQRSGAAQAPLHSRESQRLLKVPAATPAAARPVTAAQVAQVVALAVTLPLRLVLGAANVLFGLPAQAVLSIRRALRKPTAAVTWPAPQGAPLRVEGYGRRRMVASMADRVIRWGVSAARVRHGLSRQDVLALETLPDGGLADLGATDRLDFSGHGNQSRFEDWSPREVVRYLELQGLKQIGVLNFDSCLVGSGHFLEDLGNELQARGIGFGWLSAPTEITSDVRMKGRIGSRAYTWSVVVMPWKRTAGLGSPFALNRKVLPGTLAVDFEGTVFDRQRPWWRIASSFAPWA